MKTTEENNKLIAEFMGYKKDPHFTLPDGSNYNSNMLYDYSWDWLMPVVEKIENLGFSVEMVRHICRINLLNGMSIVVSEKIPKIEATYQAVIQFVEWYNKQS